MVCLKSGHVGIRYVNLLHFGGIPLLFFFFCRPSTFLETFFFFFFFFNHREIIYHHRRESSKSFGKQSFMSWFASCASSISGQSSKALCPLMQIFCDYHRRCSCTRWRVTLKLTRTTHIQMHTHTHKRVRTHTHMYTRLHCNYAAIFFPLFFSFEIKILYNCLFHFFFCLLLIFCIQTHNLWGGGYPQGVGGGCPQTEASGYDFPLVLIYPVDMPEECKRSICFWSFWAVLWGQNISKKQKQLPLWW